MNGLQINLTILVFKDNKHYGYTTPLRAKRLIDKKAMEYWINEKAIMLTRGKSVRMDIKKSLINAEDRICYICGRDVPLKKTFTIDHAVPR